MRSDRQPVRFNSERGNQRQQPYAVIDDAQRAESFINTARNLPLEQKKERIQAWINACHCFDQARLAEACDRACIDLAEIIAFIKTPDLATTLRDLNYNPLIKWMTRAALARFNAGSFMSAGKYFDRLQALTVGNDAESRANRIKYSRWVITCFERTESQSPHILKKIALHFDCIANEYKALGQLEDAYTNYIESGTRHLQLREGKCGRFALLAAARLAAELGCPEKQIGARFKLATWDIDNATENLETAQNYRLLAKLFAQTSRPDRRQHVEYYTKLSAEQYANLQEYETAAQEYLTSAKIASNLTDRSNGYIQALRNHLNYTADIDEIYHIIRTEIDLFPPAEEHFVLNNLCEILSHRNYQDKRLKMLLKLATLDVTLQNYEHAFWAFSTAATLAERSQQFIIAGDAYLDAALNTANSEQGRTTVLKAIDMYKMVQPQLTTSIAHCHEQIAKRFSLNKTDQRHHYHQAAILYRQVRNPVKAVETSTAVLEIAIQLNYSPERITTFQSELRDARRISPPMAIQTQDSFFPRQEAFGHNTEFTRPHY